MENWEHSERVREMAEELIKFLPDLADIRRACHNIAYMESDKRKSSNGGKVFADCEKVSPKLKKFAGYDYIITVYSKNCDRMNENQMKILIYHELLHINCVRNDDGELQCAINHHDVQDFHAVVDRFGLYWHVDDDVPDILEEYNAGDCSDEE